MDFSGVARELGKHRFGVRVFSTKEEALAYLDEAIDAATVGFGGSETLAQMGLYEALAAHNEVHWHHLAAPDEKDAERAAAAAAEVYVSSANALARTGEIVQIDGVGNRVSSLFYGHSRLYYVIGRNKLADDLEAAVWRARNVAAPLNTRRLGRKTPCALGEQRCYDCLSPERICRGLAVMYEPMPKTATEVILIDEDLGY